MTDKQEDLIPSVDCDEGEKHSFMLPIANCEECRKQTLRDTGMQIEDAECPSLCERCSDLTLKAWEAHRDGELTVGAMQRLFQQKVAD